MALLFGLLPAWGQNAKPCGQVLASYTSHGQTISAYSNGPKQWSTNDCDPQKLLPPYGAYGRQFQCTELIKRFYYLALGDTTAKNWTGDAISYFASANADLPKQYANNKMLSRYQNPSSIMPAPDDILVFTDSAGTEGHVAIVTQVTSTAVDFIEQNWSVTGTSSLQISTNCTGPACTYKVADRLSYPKGNPSGVAFPVVGWLRLPLQPVHTDNVYLANPINGAGAGVITVGFPSGTISTFSSFAFEQKSGFANYIQIGYNCDLNHTANYFDPINSYIATYISNACANVVTSPLSVYKLPNYYNDGKDVISVVANPPVPVSGAVEIAFYGFPADNGGNLNNNGQLLSPFGGTNSYAGNHVYWGACIAPFCNSVHPSLGASTPYTDVNNPNFQPSGNETITLTNPPNLLSHAYPGNSGYGEVWSFTLPSAIATTQATISNANASIGVGGPFGCAIATDPALTHCIATQGGIGWNEGVVNLQAGTTYYLATHVACNAFVCGEPTSFSLTLVAAPFLIE